MAEIILTQFGGVAGKALLPGGLSLLGRTISGASLGAFAGGLAGRALDAALAPPVEGPRLSALHILDSREGASIPLVYGRMRLGGQLIWASRFREKSQERSAGKGGPKYTDYTYCVSLAVALCEGPITRIDRLWANGEETSLAQLNGRLYKGDETQMPDPLIEAIEGAGQVPAYRGLAYIVFEDMPLDRFGNRLPQISCEVVRASQQAGQGLAPVISGVNIIPASGEFVYATSPVRQVSYPGREQLINLNNAADESDFSVSLQQLKNDLPEVGQTALTVAWFGTDLRAGHCRIKPGVEARERQTRPYAWSVDGLDRQSAHLISQTGGAPNFGGTPADRAVLEGLQAMKAQGLKVTLSPFLLMDIPPGNGLPDPYGGTEQGRFPWRGRITVEADGSEQARQDIDLFMGEDHGFGYRHFILHHARLAVLAGGVEAFLLGSEIRGLTRIRDQSGRFPFIEALCELAHEVRAIIGPNTRISYAADWTEYGAYMAEDDSSDVLFPMDRLWADPEIDFVGIDWYPPMGDWREGDMHLDALAGFKGPDDAEYLAANLQGGEGFDWYYASQEARGRQQRTPIRDTAYQEDWVFRQKDLIGWWQSEHYPRPGGIRDTQPTDWRAEMKPLRLIEIGFPAVDRGGNAPNLFFDPKSSESALPPYSSGLRDDLLQTRALLVAVPFWAEQRGVEQVLVWAWDGRPWPYYPLLESVWSDGPNWAYGHWLNGRTGLIRLSEILTDLGQRSGLSFTVQGLDDYVEGFVSHNQTQLVQLIRILSSAYQFRVLETESGLDFRPMPQHVTQTVADKSWVEEQFQVQQKLLEKQAGRLWLNYISGDEAYAPALTEVRLPGRDMHDPVRTELPLVLSASQAQAMAERLLHSFSSGRSLQMTLGPQGHSLDPGDLIEVYNQLWQVDRKEISGLLCQLELSQPSRMSDRPRFVEPGRIQHLSSLPAMPECQIIDVRPETGSGETGPLLALAASPWPGRVSVKAGSDTTHMTERLSVGLPCGLGDLKSPLIKGVGNRWDWSCMIDVWLPGQTLARATRLNVLNGANRLLIEGETGWELLAYQSAELISEDCWRLSGLLRGLSGSQIVSAPVGARLVMADNRVQQAFLSPEETGLPRVWQAADAPAFSHIYENRAGRPLRVGHLRAAFAKTGWTLGWTRRGHDLDPSWTSPEAENRGQFRAQSFLGDQLVRSEDLESADWFVAAGTADQVRVAQLGADRRTGPWVCIPLETP